MIGFHKWVSGVPRWHTVPPSVCQTLSCLPRYLRYPGLFTMQMMQRSIIHTTAPKNIFHELHRAAPAVRPACFIEQRITNVSKISKLIKVILSQPQACPGEQIYFTFIEYRFNFHYTTIQANTVCLNRFAYIIFTCIEIYWKARSQFKKKNLF